MSARVTRSEACFVLSEAVPRAFRAQELRNPGPTSIRLLCENDCPKAELLDISSHGLSLRSVVTVHHEYTNVFGRDS